MRFSKRMPVCSTRALVSGFRFSVTVSVLPPLIFPLASIAKYVSSRIFAFGAGFRSRPRISTPNSTEAFGAVPLNGAANTCIVNPLTGSGLSSASRTSGLAAFAGCRLRRRRLDFRQRVPAPRAHREAGPSHADIDLVKLSGLVGRRIVRQHVVGAVVPHDPVERVGELIAVDDREAAGLVRYRPQAVLRQPDLVLQRAAADAERTCRPETIRELDALVAEIGQAARVDAVDRDVRARRRGDRARACRR